MVYVLSLTVKFFCPWSTNLHVRHNFFRHWYIPTNGIRGMCEAGVSGTLRILLGAILLLIFFALRYETLGSWVREEPRKGSPSKMHQCLAKMFSIFLWQSWNWVVKRVGCGLSEVLGLGGGFFACWRKAFCTRCGGYPLSWNLLERSLPCMW